MEDPRGNQIHCWLKCSQAGRTDKTVMAELEQQDRKTPGAALAKRQDFSSDCGHLESSPWPSGPGSPVMA